MSTGKIISVSPGTVFTNIYTEASIPLGTKLLIQNVSSSPILVCLYSSPQEQGFVVLPFDHYVVPSGVQGCFVRTTSGLGGTLSVEVGAWNAIGVPLDERVYTGLKALTVQPFIESNVKNGTQWEVSFENNSVPAGSNVDAVMTTGNQYVLIKSRQISFTGSEIEASVYKNPTFTGGSNIAVYNLNTSIIASPSAILKTGVVVTSTGLEIAAKTHAYGTDTNVNQSTGSFNVLGLERVLQPNTSYLLRIANQSTITIKVAGYITFYEGEISSLN
jgi:hypothetical protein